MLQRISFNIGYKENVIRGDYQVVTTLNSTPVKIVCWDAEGKFPIIGYLEGDEATPYFFSENGTCPVNGLDLCLEKKIELTEFEKEYIDLVDSWMEEPYLGHNPIQQKLVDARCLYEIAVKQVIKEYMTNPDGFLSNWSDIYDKGFENGVESGERKTLKMFVPVKGWLARDKTGTIRFFPGDTAPISEESIPPEYQHMFSEDKSGRTFKLDSEMFPEITPDENPVKAEILIRKINE